MPVAQQYGDALRRDAEQARIELGHILGPVPRYLYQTLDDIALAQEIEKRWVAKRLEMSQRIVMDDRCMRYMDPERVQHHWMNFWTGEPNKKLQHSNTLAVGIINYPRAVVEAITALLVGQTPDPYMLSAIPWNRDNPAAAVQAELVEEFVARWQAQPHEGAYQVTLNDRANNIVSVGRNWNGIWLDPNDPLPRGRNVYPGAVASFWQSDKRTLECAIVATEMLPGEADAMYPGHTEEIQRAIHHPSTWHTVQKRTTTDGTGTTWDNSSTVTVLTSWYRTAKNTIGQAVVLCGAASDTRGHSLSTILLAHRPDTGYLDIPLYCVPRFKTGDRPPDEAQGVLFDIAPIVTMLDELVSAGRDMLWRAIYQRYVLSNAYGRPPSLIPNTSIIALRAGQDLKPLMDVLQNTPIDTFIARLEEYIKVIPGLSDYFLGRVPPTETSGEAITRSINASITRLAITRSEFATGELWQYRQLVTQAARWYKGSYDGQAVSLAPVLRGDYRFSLSWVSDNPADAVKAKQLALAAQKAGIIALETAQRTFGITSTIDEQRKIRRDRMDVVMRPDIVQLTAGARGAMLNLRMQERAALAPPQPQTPPVKVSLSGQVDPLTAAKLAEQATQMELVPGGPVVKELGAGSGAAKSASDTVSGQMTPPRSEGDNSRVMDMEGEAPG